MIRNSITNIHVQEHSEEFVKEDHYHLDLTKLSKNKHLKHHIFRFGVWVKNKLIDRGVLSPVYGYRLSFTTNHVTIDLNRLDKVIEEEIWEFAHRGIEIDSIIVGRDNFYKMMGDDRLRQFIHFHTDVETNSRPSYYLRNVRMIMNPYMEGIVFIPKDIL